MARVRITINQAAINALVTNPASPVYRHMVQVGATVSAVAKIEAPVNDGHLRRTIDYELIPQAPRLTARVVAPVNYAYFVHEGHGEILPKYKKALMWRVRGRGPKVFARRVRPVAGNPFLVRAVQKVLGKTPQLGG